MYTRNVYTSERVNDFHGFDPEDLGFYLDSHQFGGEDYFFKLGVCNGYFGIGDVTWWVGSVLNKLTDVDYFGLLNMLDRNKKMKKIRDEFIPKAAKFLEIDEVYLRRTDNKYLMQMVCIGLTDGLKEYFLKLQDDEEWNRKTGFKKVEQVPIPEKSPEEIIQESMKYFYEEGSSKEVDEEYQLYLKLKRKYEK